MEPSLSALAAVLPPGFYAAPRFELPESMWEAFNRLDPGAVIHDVGRSGWEMHLNEVVGHDDLILYTNPGDFQLVAREDLFAVDGFNEEMLLGWHIDTNLFRRISLLHGGVPPGDLVDRVLAYHRGHLRQLTSSHRRDAPTDDYTPRAGRRSPTSPHNEPPGDWLAPTSRRFPSSAHAHTYLDVLQKTSGSEGEQRLLKAATFFDYDEQHVLPFLLNEFVNAPRSLAVAWFGREPGMLRRFLIGWRQMGFTGPVLVPCEFCDALRADAAPGVAAMGLIEVCARRCGHRRFCSSHGIGCGGLRVAVLSPAARAG
jgi:hypothetical protein